MDVTGFPETRPDQGRRGDHRLPRGAVRRAGHPAGAHQPGAHRGGPVRGHRAPRRRGLDPRPAGGHRGGDRQESRAAWATPPITRPVRAVSGRDGQSSLPSPIRACGRGSAGPSAPRTSSTTRALRPTAIASRTGSRSTNASRRCSRPTRVDEAHRSAHRRRRPVRTGTVNRRRAARCSAGRPGHARRDSGRRGVGEGAGEPRQAVGRAGAAARPPPELGEHTDEIGATPRPGVDVDAHPAGHRRHRARSSR